MENTNTELTETKNHSLMLAGDMLADVGVSSDDIEIPKLLLMQNTSEFVGDEKAKLGDIVNSQSMEVVGGFGTPVEIIPLKMEKFWLVYDLTESPPKYIRTDKFVAANAKLPYEDFEDGKPIRRDLCMNFKVLLRKDLKEGVAYPCNLLFKRTSFRAGKQLASLMFQYLAMKKNHLEYSAVLSSIKDKIETNTFAIFGISKGTKVSQDEALEAQKWYNILKEAKVKEDIAQSEDVPF